MTQNDNKSQDEAKWINAETAVGGNEEDKRERYAITYVSRTKHLKNINTQTST